ncbi:hypothetical protein [Streptomyces venetus]
MTDALSESEHEPARTLANLLAEQLGEEHPLVRCTRYGIAFHHAALPTDVLEGVEDALRNGVLKAVVSTTTLTDRVNLPVRTVVILAGLESADGDGGSGAPRASMQRSSSTPSDGLEELGGKPKAGSSSLSTARATAATMPCSPLPPTICRSTLPSPAPGP